jgi:hypothetical protein
MKPKVIDVKITTYFTNEVAHVVPVMKIRIQPFGDRALPSLEEFVNSLVKHMDDFPMPGMRPMTLEEVKEYIAGEEAEGFKEEDDDEPGHA